MNIKNNTIKELINLPSLCESFSQRNILEVLAVVEGEKDVVRVPIKNNEWGVLSSFCKKNNFSICHSNFKISLVRKTTLGDIFTENVPWDSNSDKVLGFVAYIASTDEYAQLAANMESHADSEELGKLYQYPSCCVKAYSEKIENGGFWLESVLYATSGCNHSFYSNKIAYLFDDTSIISDYFPCSLNCKKTIAIGKKYRDILLKYNLEKLYIEIKNILCKTIIIGDGFLIQFDTGSKIVSPNNSRLFQWKNKDEHIFSNHDYIINIDYDLNKAYMNKDTIGELFQFSDK